MVQGACAWHDDIACTAVLTPAASWTTQEILRVMRDLHDFGRPLHPRIVHVACNPAHYSSDLRSSRPPAAPDQFYHFLCFQHSAIHAPIRPHHDMLDPACAYLAHYDE
eukprot:10660577-Alexandrium_andersonii.AAC.1